MVKSLKEKKVLYLWSHINQESQMTKGFLWGREADLVLHGSNLQKFAAKQQKHSMKTKYLFKREVKAKAVLMRTIVLHFIHHFKAPSETQGPEMEPTESSFPDSFKAWMGAKRLELQCDPARKWRMGKSRLTLFLNGQAQYFLSSPAYCPFANIRLCALQAKFQIQVRTTLNTHGTSQTPLLNMASVPPPYQMQLQIQHQLHHQWELWERLQGLNFDNPIPVPVYFLFLGHTLSHRWHLEVGHEWEPNSHTLWVLSKVHTGYTIRDLLLKL